VDGLISMLSARGKPDANGYAPPIVPDELPDGPEYDKIIEAMRANDIAGVTVYRGILGYGAHRRKHKEKPQLLSHDGSIMLSAIDTEEKIRGFLPLIEQMVEEGMVVLSDVDIIKYAHRASDV